MLEHLLGTRVVDLDTLVVGTHPVIVIAVDAGSVHLAQLNATEVVGALLVLTDTITVEANPYLAEVVLIEVAHGIVRNGGLVILVGQELAYVLRLEVNDEHTLVVGTQPQPAVAVNEQVPHLQVLRQTRDAS